MLERFIAALNSLNTFWGAVCIILIGMSFDLACKHYGVSNDAATGVIGAGIGLLTGQALSKSPGTHMQIDSPPSPPSTAPKE